MKLEKHWYEVGDTEYSDRVGISDLDRSDYTTNIFLDRHLDRLAEINLHGNVAVLYVGGASLSATETRETTTFECSVNVCKSGTVIKSLQAYMMHKYIGILSRNNKVTYANISAGACASSMYSLYEAERLLRDRTVDYVIIVAEEKTSRDTIRIFSEHGIDIKVGEGFACVVLSNAVDGVQVTNTKWEYEYNRNPFAVSKEGYEKVNSECDIVKGHKTGTAVNDDAEKKVFGNIAGYKDKIGHCQGASGLIEMCMVVDDENLNGNVLCVASGLGGFYGSCVVRK